MFKTYDDVCLIDYVYDSNLQLYYVWNMYCMINVSMQWIIWFLSLGTCVFEYFSDLPYDVTTEQALKHEEVRALLGESITRLTEVTDRFLNAIFTSLDKIP